MIYVLLAREILCNWVTAIFVQLGQIVTNQEAANLSEKLR